MSTNSAGWNEDHDAADTATVMFNNSNTVAAIIVENVDLPNSDTFPPLIVGLFKVLRETDKAHHKVPLLHYTSFMRC